MMRVDPPLGSSQQGCRPEKLTSRASEQLLTPRENSVHMLQLDVLKRYWLLLMPPPQLATLPGHPASAYSLAKRVLQGGVCMA
jgi:hypothetical protein